jgi:hypothetical protein
VEVAEISGVTLSPDGRQVAYRVGQPSIAENVVRLDWYVVPVDGGIPKRIGSGGAAQFGGAGAVREQSPVWDADSKGLRFLALREGAVGLWHWRADSGLAVELVPDADIIAFEPAEKGQAIRYVTGATRAAIAAAERSAYDDGTLVDHRLDPMEPIAGGGIEDGKRVMMRLPGAWFTRERILFDAARSSALMPAAMGAVGDAAPQGDKVDSADGSRAEIGDETRIFVTRPDGSRLACRAAPCLDRKIGAIAWRPGFDELILFEPTGSAREQLWLWRVGSMRARKLAAIDGAQRSADRPPRCALGRDRYVCAVAGPDSPPQLVTMSYSDRARRLLDDPNRALRARISVNATAMRWPRGVTGILLTPKKMVRPLPLVIQYYRCPGFLKGGIGDEIPMLPLVENGIAVLCMDRVRAPKEAGTEASYALALADIDGAVGALVDQGLVDPRHVGIGGLSFGSEVAFYGIRNTRRFAAATLASGQMSPAYYWANALPGRGFAAMLKDYWKIGDPDSDPAGWRRLSAIFDVGPIDTPLLMQLPESEARYVLELHTKLKLAGKPAELFAFADEPHIKKQPTHKRAVYERNLDWYRFWLKGEEDADPAKAEQYLRWRGYRAAAASPLNHPDTFGRASSSYLVPAWVQRERTQRSTSAICRRRI